MNEYSYSYTTYIVGLGPEVSLVRWRPTISQPVWEVLRLCYEIPGYVPTRHPLDTCGQWFTGVYPSPEVPSIHGEAEAGRVGQPVAKQGLSAGWVLGCGTQAEILKVVLRGELERG